MYRFIKNKRNFNILKSYYIRTLRGKLDGDFRRVFTFLRFGVSKVILCFVNINNQINAASTHDELSFGYFFW